MIVPLCQTWRGSGIPYVSFYNLVNRVEKLDQKILEASCSNLIAESQFEISIKSVSI